MLKPLLLLLGLLCLGAAQAQPADKELPREVVINGVEFIRIPGGWTAYPFPNIDPRTGQMRGNPMRELKVWTDTYYIAKYEARARDFLRFMTSGKAAFASHYDPHPLHAHDGATSGCSVRKDDSGSLYLTRPEADLPATHLSWDLANEFAAWMGFRLPTDAEWVRAFRGDDKRLFPWGDEYPDDTFAGFQEGGTECNVQPVDALPKGRSPFGVYNMAGNVYEYVADWVNAEYLGQLKDGTRNPVAATAFLVPQQPAPRRVLRGGRWASGPGELSIYGNRDSQPADEPFRCYGARFALDEATVRRHLEDGSAIVPKPASIDG